MILERELIKSEIKIQKDPVTLNEANTLEPAAR